MREFKITPDKIMTESEKYGNATTKYIKVILIIITQHMLKFIERNVMKQYTKNSRVKLEFKLN